MGSMRGIGEASPGTPPVETLWLIHHRIIRSRFEMVLRPRSALAYLPPTLTGTQQRPDWKFDDSFAAGSELPVSGNSVSGRLSGINSACC
jgi:hypothetical protein